MIDFVAITATVTTLVGVLMMLGGWLLAIAATPPRDRLIKPKPMYSVLVVGMAVMLAGAMLTYIGATLL